MLVSLVRYSVLQVIAKRLGERKKYSEKVRKHKGLTIWLFTQSPSLKNYNLTYDEVREKSNKKLCSFINFASKDSMRMGICCHEASHACDAIEDAIGMEHGGEPSAYLIGWIASCINKARLGIGDFVEIKDKEEK